MFRPSSIFRKSKKGVTRKIDIETLKEHIKKEEGFRNKVYRDHLGNRTIGYGHLCLPNENWEDDKVYDNKRLDKTFEYDFNIAVKGADALLYDCGDVPQKVKEVIIEMVFQMGKTGVGNFKKMFAAIKEQKFDVASMEMLDSRWAKQTPNRAYALSDIMKDV